MLVTDDPLIDSLISERYRIRSLLGEGGMGRVYRAHHELMRKDVALKVLHYDHLNVPELVERFEREALATAHINHPHVAGATDFGQLEDGSYYLVLELIEGRALSAELAEQGALLPQRALQLSYQIATALEAAHAQGIIHRDLKPDNIMLKQSEQGEFAKVTDFGIARVPVENNDGKKALTQAGMVYGTPEYMAPEQALGLAVDERADLFALGMVMFEMFTGQRPYSGPISTLLGQQLSEPLPSMEERGLAWNLSATARNLVIQLLDKEVTGRPRTAKEVVRTLLHAAQEQVPLEGQRVPQVRTWRERLSQGSRPSLAENFSKTEERKNSQSSSTPFVSTQALVSSSGRNSAYRWQSVLLLLLAGLLGFGLALFFSRSQSLDQSAQPMTATPIQKELALSEKLRLAKLGGLAGVEALSQAYPEEPQVVAQLSKQLVIAGKLRQGVEEARRALELDPAINRNPALRGALFRAAQTQQVGYEVQRLLQSAMGESGIDVLYDLANLPEVNISTRQRVKQLLKKPALIASASAALKATLELEQAHRCPDIVEKLENVRLRADSRAQARLEQLKQQVDCQGKSPCLPCLKSAERLEQVQQELRKWP